MKKWAFLMVLMLLAMTLFVAGCSDDDDDPVDGDTADGDTADGDTADGDTADGDTTDGDTAAGEMVGAACAADTDCVTDFCLTAESAAGLGLTGLTVEGGYCSSVMCNIAGDDTCNDTSGGLCLSLFPFMGADFATMGICLKPCNDASDCRAEVESVCLDPMQWVTDGLLTQADYDAYFDGVKACVHPDVAAAATGALMPDGDVDGDAEAADGDQ